MSRFCKKLIADLAIFLFITGLSGCSVFLKDAGPEPIASPEVYHQIARTMETARVEVDAGVTIDSPDISGSVGAKFTFNTIDSLRILFRDPIGRKAALLDLNDNQYLLRMLRKREKYSGVELPAPYNNLLISKLSFSEFRNLLLGIPLCEINENLNCSTQNGLAIQTIFQPDNMLLDRIIVMDESGNKVAEIKYSAFKEIDGLIFPEKLSIQGLEEQFSLDIHFTSYNIQTNLIE